MTFLRMRALRLLVRILAVSVGGYLLALLAWFVPGVPQVLGGGVAVALVGIQYASMAVGLGSLALTAIMSGWVWCRRASGRGSSNDRWS
jgi:hypothetical protein